MVRCTLNLHLNRYNMMTESSVMRRNQYNSKRNWQEIFSLRKKTENIQFYFFWLSIAAIRTMCSRIVVPYHDKRNKVKERIEATLVRKECRWDNTMKSSWRCLRIGKERKRTKTANLKRNYRIPISKRLSNHGIQIRMNDSIDFIDNNIAVFLVCFSFVYLGKSLLSSLAQFD